MKHIGLIIWPLVIFVGLSGCGYKTHPRPATATTPGEIILVNAYAYPDRITLKWFVPAFNTDGTPFQNVSGFKIFKASTPTSDDCDTCGDKKNLFANIDYQTPTNAKIKDGEVTFVDKTVKPGHTYYYAVTSYNLKGREAKPSPDVKIIFEDIPESPKLLRADMERDSVRLTWTSPDGPSRNVAYRIYRGPTSEVESMKLVGGSGSGENTFLDRTVSRSNSYFYVVRSARMNQGVSIESNPSNVVNVLAPAVTWGAPENINMAATRDGIRIYWNPVRIENEETRYNIYRSEQGGVFERINPEPLRNAWFVDEKVVVGRSYRYAVTAFPKDKPNEESSRSGSESIKYNP